jgi:hypothetical protein
LFDVWGALDPSCKQKWTGYSAWFWGCKTAKGESGEASRSWGRVWVSKDK